MAKQELLATIIDRYRKSSKKDKSRILDEFISVTGHHRKHGIRLLAHSDDGKDKPTAVRGQRIYDEAVREAMIVVWEASCRPHPYPPANRRFPNTSPQTGQRASPAASCPSVSGSTRPPQTIYRRQRSKINRDSRSSGSLIPCSAISTTPFGGFGIRAGSSTSSYRLPVDRICGKRLKSALVLSGVLSGGIHGALCPPGPGFGSTTTAAGGQCGHTGPVAQAHQGHGRQSS